MNDKEVTLSEAVSEHYKKFFDRFKEIEILPLKDWKALHILAYICKKYEDHYNIKYSFKFNNPAPSKSYEIFTIKKISQMLSSDPEILKNYIDWVFEKKVIERKKRLTVLGYFANVDIINEYKFKYLLVKKTSTIGRTDALPSNVSAVCARNGFNIGTYAELAFIKKMPNQQKLFDELLELNFPVDILDKIA